MVEYRAIGLSVVYSVRNNNYYYKVKLKKLNRDIRPKPIRHKLTTSHNMLATAEITNKNPKKTQIKYTLTKLVNWIYIPIRSTQVFKATK